MQSILDGARQKAGEAVTSIMSTNKKTADMKPNMVEQSSSDRLTSGFGVKQNNTNV
jgi:catalase